MKIYTKKGDQGETSILGGTRLSKSNHRIEAYGSVDELNAWMGFLSDKKEAAGYQSFIQEIQHNLFTIGSHLAADPEKNKIKLPDLPENSISALEASIDEMETTLEPLKSFVLPGGHPSNSVAHIARTVCRRAERAVVDLNHLSPVDSSILSYLNRLSDWLFVFARKMSSIAGAEEVKWNP